MLGVMRILAGLAVVGTAIAAGVLYRSPWIIALLTLSFTVLYVGGKFSQWQMLARMSGLGAVARALALTLPIQAFLCGLFYLVGLGIGALFGHRSFADRLDGFDVALSGGLLVPRVDRNSRNSHWRVPRGFESRGSAFTRNSRDHGRSLRARPTDRRHAHTDFFAGASAYGSCRSTGSLGCDGKFLF